MKKKIYSLILTLVICASTIYFIPNKIEADTVPPPSQGIGLDYDFVWDNTEAHCNVVYKYEEGKIPMGRAFGSWGSNYWADRLFENMSHSNICGLDEVKKLRLEHIENDPNPKEDYIGYSTHYNVTDFSISISHTNPFVQYPYPNPMPITELFPAASNLDLCEDRETYTWTFNDAKVYDFAQLQELFGAIYPFGGTYNGYYLNITYQPLNNLQPLYISDLLDCITLGNASYIASEDNIPENQDGKVFLIEEEPGCQEKLDNITDAVGCVLINYDTIGNIIGDATQYSFSVSRTYMSENEENLTTIINMLENEEIMMVDNCNNEDIMTFTYNLEQGGGLPSSGYYAILCKGCAPSTKTIPSGLLADLIEMIGLLKFNDGWRQWGDWTIANIVGVAFWVINQVRNAQCIGPILYDFTNTHFMGPYAVGLPIYSVNNSVGTWMRDHIGLFRPKVSGFLKQKFLKETEECPGAEAWNVVGYRNVSHSPNDEIVVISNRYDGMWGQTPGDAGVGGAIVLGIAKYFNDFDITPKYNLTFLMTNGEDYGFRGARHFIYSHPESETEYKYQTWIGTDQLAFNQVGTNLSVCCNDPEYLEIVEAIAEETRYFERNGEKYGLNFSGAGGRSEDHIWKDRSKTICIVKDNDSTWDLYHRAGMNYAEGDTFENTDKTDVDLTLELVWNITKYFTVDPNCWFSDITFTPFDRKNDSDELYDSIRADFTIDTILPHDLTRLDVFLATIIGGSGEFGQIDTINYKVTSNGLECSYIYALSPNSEEGDYSLSFDLYNSTGIVNEIVYTSSDRNDTGSSDFFHLYPPTFVEHQTRYFDLYDFIEYWEIRPDSMVDGNPMVYAETNICGRVEKCNRLSPSPYVVFGDILKVELRTVAHSPIPGNTLVLRPVFQGFIDGDNHYYILPGFVGLHWSDYFDITNDTNAPPIWTWNDIDMLDCDVEAYSGIGPFMCAIVEVRVTYIPGT